MHCSKDPHCPDTNLHVLRQQTWQPCIIIATQKISRQVPCTLHCTALPPLQGETNYQTTPKTLHNYCRGWWGWWKFWKVFKLRIYGLYLDHSLTHCTFHIIWQGRGGCQVKPRPMAFKDNLFAAKDAIFGIFEAFLDRSTKRFPKNKDFFCLVTKRSGWWITDGQRRRRWWEWWLPRNGSKGQIGQQHNPAHSAPLTLNCVPDVLSGIARCFCLFVCNKDLCGE